MSYLDIKEITMEEEDEKMTMDIDIKKPGVNPPEKIIIRNCKEIKGNNGWDLLRICPNHDDHHESLAINRTQKRFRCLVPTCGFAGVLWEEEKAHPKKQDKAVVAYRKFDKAWIYYDSDNKTPLHRTCKTIYKENQINRIKPKERISYIHFPLTGGFVLSN